MLSAEAPAGKGRYLLSTERASANAESVRPQRHWTSVYRDGPREVGHLSNRLQQLRAPLKNRSLAVLLSAQALSSAGDWAARIALAVLVFDKTGSAALTGLVVTVSVLPWIGIGQVLATLGDRLPRRQLMIGCDLISAAAFAAMVIPMPTAALLVLAFIAALPTPPFTASRAALLPETVPPNQYPDALALATIVSQVTTVVGYLLGGALVALIGTRGALLVNALSFAGSALVLTRLEVGRTPASKSSHVTLRDGASSIWRDVMIRRAVLFFAAVNLGAIIPESIAVVYALKHLGSSDVGSGILAAAVPIGMIALVSLLPIENHPAQWLLRAAGIITASGAAAALLMFGIDAPLPWIVLGFAAIGVTLGSAVPTNTVFGSRVPNESRASAFGLAQGTLLAADGTGALLGGILASVFDVRVACIVAAGYLLAVGALGALFAPHEEVPQPARPRMPPAPPPPPVSVGLVEVGGRRPPAPPPRPMQSGEVPS
jgi:MFS family permease